MHCSTALRYNDGRHFKHAKHLIFSKKLLNGKEKKKKACTATSKRVQDMSAERKGHHW
jgi:hypothetical protein